MKVVRKTQIEFRLFGSLERELRDFTIIPVDSRDISSVEIPKDAYGYRFFDILNQFSDDGVWLGSDRVDFTPFYYFGGIVYTIAKAKKALPKLRDTMEKMERYGTKKIISFKNGKWDVFNEHDLIIKRPRTKRVSNAPRKKL